MGKGYRRLSIIILLKNLFIGNKFNNNHHNTPKEKLLLINIKNDSYKK